MKNPNDIEDDKLWIFISLITREVGYNLEEHIEKEDKQFLKRYRQYMHCLPHDKMIRDNILALAIYSKFFEIYVENQTDINNYHENI